MNRKKSLATTIAMIAGLALASPAGAGRPATVPGCGCPKPLAVETRFDLVDPENHVYHFDITNEGCQRVVVTGMLAGDDRGDLTPVDVVLQPHGEAQFILLATEGGFVGTASDCHGQVQQIVVTTSENTP